MKNVIAYIYCYLCVMQMYCHRNKNLQSFRCIIKLGLIFNARDCSIFAVSELNVN